MLPYNPTCVFNAAMNIGERRRLSRRLYRRFPEPLHALRECHLDLGQAHAHVRRQLLLHATQHAGRTHRTRERSVSPISRNSFKGLDHLYRPTGSSPPRSCKAMPTATSAPTKPANTFRTSFRFAPTSASRAGLRFDWDGGLTEKNGNLYNFDPALYYLRRDARTPSSPTASSSPATTSCFPPKASAIPL